MMVRLVVIDVTQDVAKDGNSAWRMLKPCSVHVARE